MVKKLIIAVVVVVLTAPTWASQDPTAPLGWQTPVYEKPEKRKVRQYRLPTLNSIVCRSSTECIAVMDNTLVEKGEFIKGYRVVNINNEFVTLKRGSRRWNLKLFGLNVKK